MITFLLHLFEFILGNFYFLLAVISLSFTLKFFLLISLIIRSISSGNKIHRSLLFLFGMLSASMIANAAWIIKLSGSLFLENSESFDLIFNTIIRPFAWIFPIVEYQSSAFFIENLADKHFKLTPRRKLLLLGSIGFFVLSCFLAFNKLFAYQTPAILNYAKEWCSMYCLFPLSLTSIAFAIWSMYFQKIPRILRKQLAIILKAFIIPHWFFNIIQLYPFNFSTNVQLSYAVVGLSALLNTFAIYYCSRKVIGLRFLNFNKRTQAASRFNFVNSFKDVLEQFSLATSNKELTHITQTFFKESFNIPINRTSLHIRHESSSDAPLKKNTDLSTIEMLVETFLVSQPESIARFINSQAILITDEIEFTNFYETSEEQTQLLHFLDTVNADIFLPIYKNNSIIAYIIVDRFARNDQFYSDSECDEMLIFAHYSGNMIHLLKSRQLESIIHQEKELKEELYNKHQEINQYKESIRSFLRTKPKEIGIIFYKNRRFIIGNQMAQELIKINLNTQDGHPLTKIIKQVAHQVSEYKSPQTAIFADNQENKLVISGVPNLEKNNVILTIYPPDISDIVKRQFDMLKDPTKWDYLLYLETTKSGQLINQLIPGSGETLLNFKIDLLKMALSKKAILLNMPNEDLLPTVEILHHISLREKLHILSLKGTSAQNENAIKLFGINPIFGMHTEKSLLDKLDNTGTLFIENIHFLEMEAQEYLAEYLKYGIYKIFKSDQKRSSNVRIICSSNQNLSDRVANGSFSSELYNQLNQATLSSPSLLTLSEDELNELSDGFSHLVLHNQPFLNLLELTEKEKHKLALARPVSLTELKNKVQQLITLKSKKNQIEHETQFDPALEVTSPDLVQAARLGKHALKDRKIMVMLWEKFKNQNKIASFLGVNRSSVNRRCKEFNLE